VRTRVVLVLALFAVCVAASSGGASVGGTTLRLDGVPFRPEFAMSDAARARGLMYRKPAPADGMLFVFPRNTTGGFWMKNTLVPLTIVFFDAEGKRVRRLSMTTCRDGDCPIYNPGRVYRFALELRASDRRPARRLGPLSELRRLSRQAR
jgi:uncharacterized membrane protein (UPF0127 family)